MKMVRLGDLVVASGRKAGATCTDLPVHSVTKHRGFVPSLEYFKKQVFSRDLSEYSRVAVGEFAYATIHLDEGSIGIADTECLISPMYTIFRVADDSVHAPYVLRYLKSPRALTEYSRLGRGSVHRRRSISFAALSQMFVPLPPVEDQRRIAVILDQADGLRAKRREALAHLDDLTQSIFVDMFGDPVTNPRGWSITTLAQLGQLDRGVSRHRPRNDALLLGGRHPLVQTGEVANSGGYIRTFTETYSEIGLAQSKKWPTGTLCITIAANIAKTGILTFDACFPDSVVGFTSDKATTQYVRVWLGFLQATLERAAPQSAQKNINLAILRNLPVPKPPAESIELFARRVERLEEAKSLATTHSEGLDGLVVSLQSRAFEGEL